MSEEYKVVEGRIYKRWKSELSKPRLKGKLSFEESLHLLVNRCMTCAPEEYPENVQRLFWALPKAYRDDELIEEYEGALEKVEYVTPVTCCGVPVDPQVIPARKEIVTETDWHLLFNAILNCLNRRNLLIPKERVEVVTEPI